jgi:hypothetical protein
MKTTSYLWDSMDEEDREDTMDILKQSDEWSYEGWWRTGDIRVKKPKKTYQCWVKNKTKVPLGAQEAIITALQEPNHNFGKDKCVVDMIGHETHYWQGTESGLLGAFEFKGSCTAGDG